MPRFWMLPACLRVPLSLMVALLAATASAQPPSAQDERREQAHVGIGGVYRVGYWTGVRLPAPTKAAEATHTAASAGAVRRVETLDGNGVRVHYHQAEPATPGQASGDRPGNQPWSYIVPGTELAPLRLSDADDQLIWQGRIRADALDPATPWVVVLGDSLGLETIGRSELLGREASVAVVNVDAPDELPDQAVGWDGVDLLIINPPASALLGNLDPQRVAAIVDWVHGGGRLFVSLGRDGGEMLSAAPWLAELIDLPAGEQAVRLDPAALETYTTSQSPLRSLEGYPLPSGGARTLIAGRTATRQPANLAIERSVGLGRVTITAFSPDSPEMVQWPERTTLVARLHPGLLDAQGQRRREPRNTAAVAYADLAGQIHAALDRFPSHRRTPFSIVSLIVLLVAVLIGPLDYWLVNRVFGKPLLGWVSFPLSVLLVCGLVLVMNHRSAPAAGSDGEPGKAPRTNRIEVVDISAVSDPPVGRGIGLTHISSPAATRVDFAPQISPILARGGRGPDSQRQSDSGGLPALTGPYGYPSATFGGISIAGEDHSLPAYAIALHRTAPPWLTGAAGALAGGATEVPIPPAGSKSWMTRWSFRPALGETSGLVQRRGSELITGSVTNPLDVDLLNGVLVYGNWAYLLPTRLRAGQRIESIDHLRQKNFRWHLSRREALESSSRMDTWNVQMHDDLQRLTEVLMFESAIGGSDYTGLSNRPLGGLDLSHVLLHGHAILYGLLPEPLLQNDLPQERPAVSAVRIILPVAPATSPERFSYRDIQRDQDR